MLTDFRMAMNLKSATRASRNLSAPTPTRLSARDGLRYERKVDKELWRHKAAGHFLLVEHNPWFTFEDEWGIANCCPDFILHSEEELTVVEVKRTWVEVAIHKLNDLYNPVISTALGRPVKPLIICRNSAPGAPPAEFTLSGALASPFRLLQWPENGHMPW
jgi:hypothetical protein